MDRMVLLEVFGELNGVGFNLGFKLRPQELKWIERMKRIGGTHVLIGSNQQGCQLGEISSTIIWTVFQKETARLYEAEIIHIEDISSEYDLQELFRSYGIEPIDQDEFEKFFYEKGIPLLKQDGD